MGIYFTVKIRKGIKYLLPKTKIGQQAFIVCATDQLSVVHKLFATSGKQTIEQTEALSRARENKNEVSLQGQPILMPHIKLETIINAPIERCFDLARSIDLHKISTGNTQEEAIAGTTSGLIGLNETVTWRAKHFGVRQTLTSKITEFERPHFFVDEMLEGAFKSIYHKHIFKPQGEATLMIDEFHFESPLGILGVIANQLFLENYLRNLLTERNNMIKEFAESERWREVL